MLTWLKELDRLLRGEATRPAALRRGTVEVLEQELAAGTVILGALYGLCMGCYALVARDEPEYRQLLAAVLKVPALFVLTFGVTFPSLYVFNALIGCRLSLVTMLRLLIAAFSILLAVLASLGPIVAFFSVTTTHYPFILLLNVAVFAIAGTLGLGFLLQTLHRLSAANVNVEETPPSYEAAVLPADVPDDTPVPSPPPTPVPPRSEGVVSARARTVFYVWVFVFALVGAQMAWVLRPFVGDPRQPFVVFRHFVVGRSENSHVFQGLWRTARALFTEPEDDVLSGASRSGAALPAGNGPR